MRELLAPLEGPLRASGPGRDSNRPEHVTAEPGEGHTELTASRKRRDRVMKDKKGAPRALRIGHALQPGHKDFDERVVASGRSGRSAVIACMAKLPCVFYGVLTDSAAFPDTPNKACAKHGTSPHHALTHGGSVLHAYPATLT